MAARIANMKSRVTDVRTNAATKTVRLQLPQRLYQRVERTAQQTGFGVKEVIVSTLETRLPPLPEHLPPDLAADLAHWSLFDDEALLAIANAFLPAKRQRRYSTLLRKASAGRLSAAEQAEWTALQQEYLRFSQNKAKAQFLLAQRRRVAQVQGVPAHWRM